MDILKIIKMGAGNEKEASKERQMSVWHQIFYLLLVFLFFSFCLFLLQLKAPGLLCPDGFYHMKVSEMITKSGIIKDFPWLQFTVLSGERFVDHHFLFHVLAVPFVSISPLIGMKLFVSLTVGLAFSIFYFILKKFKLSHPFLWTILLLSSSGFIFRLLILRPIAFSLIFALLGFYFLKEKKYLYLFILSFLFVWSYNAFILIPIFSILFFGVEIFIKKAMDWKIIAYSFLGISAGVIFNPYFPQNLAFYKTHVLKLPFINGLNSSILVGNEWYAIELRNLLVNNFLIWLIFAGLITLLLYYRKKFREFKKELSIETFVAILLSFFFFALTVKSQRFIEYWTPFTVLAGALTVRDFKFDKKFKNWLKNLWGARSWKLTLPIFALFVLIISIFLKSITENRITLKNAYSYNRYKPATEWLIQNTPEKSIVFNTSWDDFPELFYWNTHNYYIVGMDPTFMYEYDKSLYEKWQEVGTGKDSKPSKTVKKYFDAEIIFANKERISEFIKTAENDSGLEKSYEDEWAVIYKIKN